MSGRVSCNDFPKRSFLSQERERRHLASTRKLVREAPQVREMSQRPSILYEEDMSVIVRRRGVTMTVRAAHSLNT